MLLNILNKIGGWPLLLGDKWNESEYDLMNTIHKIVQENLTLFFPIQIDAWETHYKRKILSLTGPSTVINDLFYSKSGPNEQRIVAYYNFMVNVATSLGASKSIAQEELLEVITFEDQLYHIMKPRTDLFIKISEIENLPRTKFNISWAEMIIKETGVNIGLNESDQIYLKRLYYFENLQELLDATPKKVVANYMAWHFIRTSLKYQPKYLHQLHVEFYENITGGQMLPKYICFNEMMSNLKHGMSALFVRMNYDTFINEDVMHLFKSIKEQFKINLKKMDWMDEEVRMLASRKIDAMTVELPYFKKLTGDEVDEYFMDLEINPGSYFESFLNVSTFNKNKKFENLYEEYNKSSWIAVKDAVTANGYYQYFFNQMALPAGFMRSPLYHRDRPQYLNYGGAGTIIGHEITHGFDSNGRHFDENGNLQGWWNTETLNKFLEKVNCMINQYNNFVLTEVGQHVNGSRTQNENIADNGGFKMAYYAYQTWAKRNNIIEDCLPFVNYTPQQLFWISAATNWCTAQPREIAYNNMLTDEHSPSQARVVNSFSNIKEFADDFQCKKNSKMNSERRCVVW